MFSERFVVNGWSVKVVLKNNAMHYNDKSLINLCLNLWPVLFFFIDGVGITDFWGIGIKSTLQQLKNSNKADQLLFRSYLSHDKQLTKMYSKWASFTVVPQERKEHFMGLTISGLSREGNAWSKYFNSFRLIILPKMPGNCYTHKSSNLLASYS